MKIEIDVPDYSPEDSLPLYRTANSRLSTRLEDTLDEVVITGNPEGIRSLGVALLAMAGPNVPSHWHVHLSQHNEFLEAGSLDLVVEVIKDGPS